MNTRHAKHEAPPPLGFTRYLAERLGLSPDAAEARLEHLLEHYVPLRRCGPKQPTRGAGAAGRTREPRILNQQLETGNELGAEPLKQIAELPARAERQPPEANAVVSITSLTSRCASQRVVR